VLYVRWQSVVADGSPNLPNRGQDFEKAGELRDKEMELKAKISAITGAAKEEEDAEQVGLGCRV
jgi:hypothetical protein